MPLNNSKQPKNMHLTSFQPRLARRLRLLEQCCFCVCVHLCVFTDNLLISAAITVMLCHNNISRSRGLEVNIDPFPESMLNILSISVCRSTEYLQIRQIRNEMHFHFTLLFQFPLLSKPW